MHHIKESFAVLGLSKFGFRVAVSLSDIGASVIAVDKDHHIVEKISSLVTKAIVADLMDWEVLENLGVLDVDIVVIGLRKSFDVAALLTYKLKHHAKIKKIIIQVDTDEKSEILKLIGADVVVFPEKDMADAVVRQLMAPNLIDYISLSENAAIVEVPVPKSFIGKSIIELNIRARFEVYIIGIKHQNLKDHRPKVEIAPKSDIKFQENDNILLLGTSKNLNKFIEVLEKSN